MKILFVSPPTNSVVKEILNTTTPPLGLAYLASVARQKGHEAKIIDSLVMNISFDNLEKEIKNYNPDIVAVTSTTSMIYDAYKVSELSKNIDTNIKVVLGGPHVTFTPDITFIENPNVDFIVRGEGETVFSNLLDFLDGKYNIRNVRGLSYKKDDMIVNNPPEILIKDIDSIPLPALDLLPMDRYMMDNRPFGTIMTSRGCPYNCSFCSSSLQFGKQWRGHSTERVIEELKILSEKYHKKEIEFLDDTFTLNMKRALELTEKMKKENMDISWSASSRVNLFTDELARSMKNAGLHTIYFGIESGSQKTLDFIGKGINLDLSIKAVKKANDAGLHSLGSFIIGFPDETIEDVKNTINFSKKLKVTVAQFTIATPYPGTKLWEYVMEKKLLLSRDWRMFTTLSPIIKLKNFTSKQIQTWLTKAYINFYFRPLYLIKDIVKENGFAFRRILHFPIHSIRTLTSKS
jgi:radical SAM superfamily enzyme YgiQ (UPF0313 family)